MKIHVPKFRAMAKCNAHLDHDDFDIEISDEVLREAGYEKIQRKKPLTLEEAGRKPWVFLEERDNGNIKYSISPCTVRYIGIEYDFVGVRLINKKERYFKRDDYGKVWRCWTAEPTDEERQAEPWLD